jgi:hypothetical protein
MKDCHTQVIKYQRKEVKLSNEDRDDIKGKADTNRLRLRGGLATDGKPTPIGMHTQGSYSMKTMIQEKDGDYDIDDGVYFRKEDLVGPQGGEMSALAVRQMVCAAVQDKRFTTAPEVRKNCVRIYYNEGYHIDVPSYRKIQIKDPVSGELKTGWELASSDWKRSDARAVTKWFIGANSIKCSDSSKDGNSGQFVRMARLMKRFAKSRASWRSQTTSGFAISRLVEYCYLQDEDRDDRCFRSVMREISNRLAYDDEIGHPTLSGENIVDSGNSKVAFFKKCIDENLKHLEVLDDDDCSHEAAMSAWARVFNTDWFEEQPDPDDEKKLDSSITGPFVKKGETRYA